MFSIFSRSKQPIQFWFDTDVHCHVLPGIDDGSPDPDTSVALVSALAEMGIKRIVATPHVTDVTFENTAETMATAQEQLDRALAAAGVTVPVMHASENRIDDLLHKNIAEGTLQAMPGEHLLIENSFVQESWDLESVIFDLKLKGYNPIFAHPERFTYYHESPERLKTLHNHLPFQVNVLSLAGYYGKPAKKMAEELIENGMVDFLGTDTHGMRHIETFRQYLASKDALRHRRALDGVIRNETLAF